MKGWMNIQQGWEQIWAWDYGQFHDSDLIWNEIES